MLPGSTMKSKDLKRDDFENRVFHDLEYAGQYIIDHYIVLKGM